MVRAMRNDLARWMLRRGIQQWRPGEIPLEMIEARAALGALYVVARDDEIIGSVTIMSEGPMLWGERPEPAGYIHMLMVDLRYHGHGIGRSILYWAEATILDAGRAVERLDCVKDNARLRAYYEAMDYRFVEYKTFPDIDWASETALYEKNLR